MNSTNKFWSYLFLPFFLDSDIGKSIWSAYGSWFWTFLEHKERTGMDFSSEQAVSFHYVTPDMMVILEYLIYHLRHEENYTFSQK